MKFTFRWHKLMPEIINYDSDKHGVSWFTIEYVVPVAQFWKMYGALD